MKLKTTDDKLPSNRAGRFAAAAVLVGGMALLPNCLPNVPLRQTEPAPQHTSVSIIAPEQRASNPDGQMPISASDLDNQRMLLQRIVESARGKGIGGDALERYKNLKIVTSKQLVTEGDYISGGIFDFINLPFYVCFIDSHGVGVNYNQPFEYGVPQIIGESEFQTLVSVEPGPIGTAIWTATYADFTPIPDETEQKASAKAGAGANAAPFQTSGPIWK
jgi:hypothetical protein